MNCNTQETLKGLKLYGEQINLSSRCIEESKKSVATNRGRPKSALYTSNLNTPEYGRRPFSAGTEPQSPSLHAFLRRVQTDRNSLHNIKNSEFFRETVNLPGTIPSSILFEKMMRDPIDSRSKFLITSPEYETADRYYFGYDNMSENGSAGTCTSLGTKIKVRAQNGCGIEGNSIKLQKVRPQRISSFDDVIEDDSGDLPTKERDENLKLSIYVPNSKDENTSSGVSSSSDVQNYSCNQLKLKHVAGKLTCDSDSMPYKLFKSKKSPSISINWFPENFSDNPESASTEQTLGDKSFHVESENNGLEGRLSLGKKAFQPYNYLDDGDLYDSHQAYNTQLSLVEEESSQESELSPKHLSLSLSSNNNHKESTLKENGTYADIQVINRNATKLVDNKNKDPTVNALMNYSASDIYLKRYNESEIERKFKALEDKYNKGKSVSRSFVADPCQNSGQMYSWTSLENLVSKEYETESSKFGHTQKIQEIKSTHSQPVQKPNIFNNSQLRNCSAGENQSFTKTDDSSLTLQYQQNANNQNPTLEIVKEHAIVPSTSFNSAVNYDNLGAALPRNGNSGKDSNLTISKANNLQISSQRNESSGNFLLQNREEKSSDAHMEKPRDGFNSSIAKNNANDSSSTQLNTEEFLNYPKYLERTNSRIYTSKVIEDYKNEIVTINNHHDLTLKDLRSGCSNQKSNVVENYNKADSRAWIGDELTPPQSQSDDKIESLSSPDVKAIQNMRSDETRQRPQKTDSKIAYGEENSLNKKKSYNVDEEIKMSDDSSFEKLSKRFFELAGDKSDTKTNKQRSKKKTKKRSGGSAQRNEAGNSSTEPGSNEKGTAMYSNKRIPKSAPITKKTSTNCIKFKAQKITMSKSTTNINRTVYMDSDKDVISWMATRADTPLDDTSCENLDPVTPDKTNSKDLENKHPTISPDERVIEPLMKQNPSFSPQINDNNENETFNSQFEETVKLKKETVSRDQSPNPKSKEVSFDVVKYKSAYETDDCFPNNWASNYYEDPESNDIMEDSSMVCDIYSVLKDIETQGLASVTSENTNNRVLQTDDNLSAEYRDIVNYLERVENAASEEMSSLCHTQPPFALKVEELMELSKAELAHRAVAGVLAASKAGAAEARLRAALAGAARRAGQQIRDAKITFRQRAAAASQAATRAVARHQKFIEQLIIEKGALNAKIQQLVESAAGAEARRARAARTAADRLQMELKNQRQRLTAVHQREKQAWLKRHTQKIKEMTVKSLEGELRETEEINAKRIANIQRESEANLATEREHHSKEIRSLKNAAARSLEDALDKERLLAAERMECKRTEWESAMAAVTCRAAAETREVSRRAESAAADARNEAHEWMERRERELQQRADRNDEIAKERRAALTDELSQMKSKLTEEFESYKEEYLKNQHQAMKEREAEIRAIMRRDRDCEIEKAVDCIEVEAQDAKKEMQDTIRRIKEKYESDICSLEDSEKIAIQRCKDAREHLRDSQEQCSLQQITITQLEGKIKQNEEFKIQNAAHTDILIRAAETRGRDRVEELQTQLHEIHQQHKDEMHQLYAKVKIAVSKKDDALTAARREATSLRERCIRLEGRLATQQ